MNKNGQRWSATPDEFFTTVETEFEFLVSEHGYQREIPPDHPFTAEFHRGPLRIRVSGINYGFGAYLEFFIDGQFLPLWPLMTKFTEQKTAPSDKPQLDELREYAWRLRHECSAIVAGDFAQVERIREAIREQKQRIDAARQADARAQFFSVADKLFRAGQFTQCATHLEQSPFELSEPWKARFEYARRRA